MAKIKGCLEANRDFCQRQMAETAPSVAPPVPPSSRDVEVVPFKGGFCSILYDMIFHCFSWRHVCDMVPLGITSCRNCTSTNRTQFESPERRFALIGPSQGLSREESYCTNFAHRTPYFRCPMGDFHGFLVQFVLNETAP